MVQPEGYRYGTSGQVTDMVQPDRLQIT
jgi:hypothetical protein